MPFRRPDVADATDDVLGVDVLSTSIRRIGAEGL